MSDSQGFQQLHRGVQKWVHDQSWESLRPVQELAITPVLNHSTDVIISAATASGKTEAAFLPACTYVKQENKPGVRILYVSPLKALINDQYRRLWDLCEKIDIPLTPWHGDTNISLKAQQKENPSGVLLITPESLEARLVIDNAWCKRAFANLDYFIIDEFHSFIGSVRGAQLLSQMERIEFLVDRQIPRIALSATFNQMEQVAECMRPHKSFPYKIIKPDGGGMGLDLQIRGYANEYYRGTEEEDEFKGEDAEEYYKKKDVPSRAIEKIAVDLFKLLRKSSNLVFTNQRRMVEELSDKLTGACKATGVPNEFFPHHGSLSKEIREDLEVRLQRGDLPTTAIATSTLELGVDIGSVDSVAQIAVASSVSSMRQRLGRSGRRGDAAVFRLCTIEKELYDSFHIVDKLRLDTVQSVAMVNLMLDKWCEPPPEGAYNFSTLVQQTLSVIAQYGSVRAKQLWQLLCNKGPFNLVDENLYAEFLRSLAEKDLIQQDHDGRILIGLKGERVVGSYHFYAAFQTDEEYTLMHQNKKLGTLPIKNPLSENETIIFAGRRWMVLEVLEKQKIVRVVKSVTGKLPIFGGGGYMMHGRIREEMYNIYVKKQRVHYLDETAHRFLEEGIENFHQLGLTTGRIIADGGNTYIILWCDDRVLHTITALLLAEYKQQKAIEAAHNKSETKKRSVSCQRGLIEITNTTTDEARETLKKIFGEPKPTMEELCKNLIDRHFEKYDWALTPELRTLGYAKRTFDIDATWTKMQKLL